MNVHREAPELDWGDTGVGIPITREISESESKIFMRRALSGENDYLTIQCKRCGQPFGKHYDHGCPDKKGKFTLIENVKLKIYIATSWRNETQPLAVKYLRAEGFDVYDFRNPCKGDHGFHWSEIDPEWQSWDADKYIKSLLHPLAVKGFDKDWRAMKSADACLLILPCGRSAHIEAGYFVGAGKFLVIMVEDKNEPELMYKMACAIVKDLDSAVKIFKRIRKSKDGYFIEGRQLYSI